MSAILTVTLNPALDIATSVDKVIAGHKLRCALPVIDPGGGGINVARAIRQLGGDATAFVALGGNTGRQLGELLEAAGLPLIVHAAPGDTRQSVAVTDLSINDQFRFMLPGPDWSDGDVDGACAGIKANAPDSGFVVLSGSGPSGSRADLYARICKDLSTTNAKVIVDTSGPALTMMALGQPERPYVLRMDQQEAESLTRYALPRRGDTADFASKLVERGAGEIVIIARGSDGNVLATKDGRWFCPAVNVVVKSKVGAGDSFVGGLTLALQNGCDLQTALCHGSAAASAACMTEGTQLCLKSDFDECLAQSEATAL